MRVVMTEREVEAELRGEAGREGEAEAEAAGGVMGAATQPSPESPVIPPSEGRAAPPIRDASKFSISGEVRYVSAYFSDGYRDARDGLNIQPLLNVQYNAVTEGEVTVSPYGYAWANLTDDHYAGGDRFEQLTLGAGVELVRGRWTLGLEYNYNASPADAFDVTHEIGASLSFDDSGLKPLPMALNPYVAVFQEVCDLGGHTNTRSELGVEPGWEISGTGVTLSLPCRLGLGANEFYTDGRGRNTLFGYTSAGVTAKYALGEHWYVTGGVQYLYMLADSTEVANSNDRGAAVAGVAIGFSY